MASWRQIEEEPSFFLPFIPVKGIQRHMWAGGCFDFQEIETIFQLVQVLVWYTGAGGAGWQALRAMYGLPQEVEPVPPLADKLSWSLFVSSCAAEESPLRFLPTAFYFISYKTGNPWLDLPQVGYVGWEWSEEKVAELHTLLMQAQEMSESVLKANEWLDEDPVARIVHVVELWNHAALVASEWDGDQRTLHGEMTGHEVYGYLQRGGRLRLT